MQCCTDLGKLRASIISRTRALRQIVSPISAPISAVDRRALSHVTIELDNLIIVGLRQYTKSSLLRSRTAAGARITASVQPSSPEEAAALVYRAINPTGYAKNFKNKDKIPEKDELIFRDPKIAEKVLIHYSASNLSNMILALSLNSHVFSEAKTYRHFFAHRARNTHEAVQKLATDLGIFAGGTPEQLLLRGRPGTGIPFLEGWLAEVELFFDLAT